MTINERLSALRERMKQEGIDMYIIFSEDFHGSEYVGGYFGCREFISGFTGSAGTVVVGMDEAGLWTDGRYFLQAASQLEGTGIELFRMGNEGVPAVEEFVRDKLPAGGCLGMDGRTISAALGRKYAKICPCLRTDVDLVGDIWEDRPLLSNKKAWLLSERYTGQTRQSRISDLAAFLRSRGADSMAVSSLDDICWLLNIRGDDVLDNPVVLAYMMVFCHGGVTLYADERKFLQADRAVLDQAGVTIAPYDRFYEDLSKLPDGWTLMLDSRALNYAAVCTLPEGVNVIDETDRIMLSKARKNPVEIENLKKAHLKDGIALTRFMYWLKTNAGKTPMTEISTAQKLESFRRQQEGYIEPSFEPISAYGPHGAIVHYSATEESNARIEPRGLLLMDTGGQYYEGTTDVTRTFVMGPLSRDEKFYFTQVLRGNLNLAAARFLYGCRGSNLDHLAREPLWQLGLDYKHGTGHGVGYLLGVHEKPNAFRWKIDAGNVDASDAVLEEGMVTSDEPGLYLAGRFGIRHENLTVCVKDIKNEYGQFMKFETLTLCPFDLDGVDPGLMTEKERNLLNDYHQRIYETIGPHIPENEREWLKNATRRI